MVDLGSIAIVHNDERRGSSLEHFHGNDDTTEQEDEEETVDSFEDKVPKSFNIVMDSDYEKDEDLVLKETKNIINKQGLSPRGHQNKKKAKRGHEPAESRQN